MDYGVVMFPTEYAIAPDELARELEERGFESVWFPEHTHIPASRRSPWPGGWNAEEMEDHGTAFKTRWRVLRERVLAMKEIWTKREAEFHGQFVRFDKIWADPKPVQKPHPPILIGGDGATTFDRVVEFGDGWMPIMRPKTSPVEKIPELRERLKKAGRDP